jgi:hypothetical protein
MDENYYTYENVPLECPECGQISQSIKRYTLPDYIIFIGIAAFWQKVTYTCCPKCMLKHILFKCFTYNIIAANFLYPFLVLPWGIISLIRNTTDGHSSEVVEILKNNIHKN